MSSTCIQTMIFAVKSTLLRSMVVVCFLAVEMLVPLYSHASSPLDTLQSQHPRLFLHDSDLPKIKHVITTDPFVRAQYQKMLAWGNELLNTPPGTYAIDGDEHTLLETSREMEGRIFTLAGLYRITGDKRYAKRATREMIAAAAFPDWNPTHFLDTGEMTAALGLGYDWLYSVLSPADRITIKNAIATKGIDPWIERIHNGTANQNEHNNWNQVCNGGETIGALAIADEEPKRASQIIDHARFAIASIMQLLAPDGGFEEGPTYWCYAMAYNVLYIDALDSALGTDFGAADALGFSATGDYRVQSQGPFYVQANFGDAGAGGSVPSAQMFWLARHFHKPYYAQHEVEVARDARRMEHANYSEYEAAWHDRFSMFLVIWAAEAPMTETQDNLPLVQSFARVNQVYIRSSWNDPNAWYIAFKGGDAHASHGHLDLGSFVMDAFGHRWASDLGPDNYGLPGYFGQQRWTYYRLRTESHNTLTIDSQNQDLDAKASLIASGTKGNTLFAVADLDQVYKSKLRSWSRGVALIDKKRVLVLDEIVPAQPVDVVWNFHTFSAAEIAPDGRSAKLTVGETILYARVLSPSSARFATASTEVPSPQTPNPGLTSLDIRLDKQAAPATIAVMFTSSWDSAPIALNSLSTWK